MFVWVSINARPLNKPLKFSALVKMFRDASSIFDDYDYDYDYDWDYDYD